VGEREMISIRLPWPPSVNAYYTVWQGRKNVSKRGRAFKKSALEDMLEQQPPKGLTSRLEVSIDAYPPDRRRRDIDNLLKPTLDILQTYGVFVDDEQIDDLRIRRREISKTPNVRVHITEIESE
jgi:crossover junction endodeoxyribonuclease RusA